MKRIGWWSAEFGTKQAAKQRVRDIVNHAVLGEALEGQALEWILEVLSHHPQWPEKCGGGVAAVQVVEYAHVYGTNRGLLVVRHDGSCIDISWVACFDGQPHDREVKQAARYEIAGQRDGVAWSDRCEICGQPLNRPIQIDHRPPLTFDVLLNEFMATRSLTWNDLAVVSRDGLHNQFLDRALAADWWSFHAARAQLRVVHKACNLSRGGRSCQ